VQFGEGIGLDPVFAGQLVDKAEALFHLQQALGVEVEAVDVALYFACCFVELDQCRIEQVFRLGQVGSFIRLHLQQVQRLSQQGAGIPLLAIATEGEGGMAVAQDMFGVSQQMLLLFQFRQFVFAQGQGVEFFCLELQQHPDSMPVAIPLVDLAGEGLAIGEQIQQAAVGVALEQRLMLVLAVNVDHQLPQLLELLHGGGLAVDKAPRAAFAGDNAAHQAFAALCQIVVCQPD